MALEAELLRARAQERGGAGVHRAALLDRLPSSTRLVIVQAPAGYGKSTLIRQFLAGDAAEAPVAWLDLEPPDHDSVRFLASLQGALRRLLGEGPRAPRPRASPGARTGGIAAELIRGLSASEGPATLVLDDYENAASPENDAILARLVSLLPEGKRIFVGTRVIPAIELPRLMLHGQATVFDAEDLRFDLAETADFLARSVDLTEDEVSAIHEHTDGWAAALQFTVLALDKGRRTRALVWREPGMSPGVIEFLARDVFETQSEPVREFLLAACLPERICVGLLRHYSGAAFSAEMFEQVERAGLFLSALDASREWFRFHNIFRRFLLSRVERVMDPEALRARHASIAVWYADNGHPEEAIHHLLQASEDDRAATLMEEAADGLVREERLSLIVSLVEKLSPEMLEQRPRIQRAAIIAYGFRRQFAKAHQMLEVRRRSLEERQPSRAEWGGFHALRLFVLAAQDRVEEMAAVSGECLKMLGADEPFEYGVALNAYAFWLCADSRFEEGHEALVQAHSLHDAAASLFGRAYQESISSTVLLAQGRLDDAFRGLRSALRFAESKIPSGSAAGGVIAAHLGEAYYERNEVGRAESLLRDYLPLIEQQCIVDPVAVAFSSLARASALRGDRGHAEDLLNRAIALGHRYDLRRLVSHARGELVRLAVLEGDLSGAERRIRSDPDAFVVGGAEGLSFHAADIEGPAICQARLMIHRGRTREARAILSGEIRRAEALRRWRRFTRLSILMAMALDFDGDANGARRAMLSALRTSAPHGFVRIFLDEGPRAVSILRGILADVSGRPGSVVGDELVDYLKSLMRHVGEGGAPTPLPAIGNAAEKTLTDREIDVLRLVATGYSNQDLSDRMGVSPNTVKFHLRNIYEKFNLKNRVQAIALARRLDLIG